VRVGGGDSRTFAQDRGLTVLLGGGEGMAVQYFAQCPFL